MNSVTVTVFAGGHFKSKTLVSSSPFPLRLSHGGISLRKRLTSCRTLLHYVTSLIHRPQAVSHPQATLGTLRRLGPASELGLCDRMPACEARGATPQMMNSKAAASGEKQCGTHRPTSGDPNQPAAMLKGGGGQLAFVLNRTSADFGLTFRHFCHSAVHTMSISMTDF